jgi:hypothetical protein
MPKEIITVNFNRGSAVAKAALADKRTRTDRIKGNAKPPKGLLDLTFAFH